MSFQGFPQETLDFLAELGAHNDREWFETRREDYERWYVELGRHFVVAAGERLRKIAPGIHAEPRILGSIFRINRDIRFSKDKRPYKDHLDFWFWDGDRSGAVSGFFSRISPQLVGIGAGSHGFDAGQRSAFREAMEKPAARSRLEQIASTLARSGYTLSSPATPAARSLYVHVDDPAGLALKPELLDRCAEHWHHLLPLHRWLVDHVQLPIATG
ncbi:MAG TPA: DUF2461 domain-containing protein [Candidatus Angelobacter sp.]|nr:DUF2461 domain-containing protein [Candidatus Angelobacter sp.]